MLNTSVREALAGDAQRIACLCVQLGYDVPLSHVQRILERRNGESEIFVAVVPRVGVVGWIAVSARDTITTSGDAMIEGLVVEDEYRGNGIGEQLLQAAQRWAAQHDCRVMRVRSNVTRERAHGFYRRLGYEVLKSQHLFEKPL